MSVETFTKEAFQAALPENAVPLGLVDGEYCWLIPVTEKAGVFVRSALDRREVPSGDDIRIYPVRCERIGSMRLYQSHPSVKEKRVRPVQGWQRSLQDSLTHLRGLIETAGVCPECGKPLTIQWVKKIGPNRGRWFATCLQHKYFIWLDE